MNVWWTLGETWRDSEGRDKSSVNVIFFLFFTFQLQDTAVHGSCGAKKYSFGSTITGYILIFSGAKNSYIAI